MKKHHQYEVLSLDELQSRTVKLAGEILPVGTAFHDYCAPHCQLDHAMLILEAIHRRYEISAMPLMDGRGGVRKTLYGITIRDSSCLSVGASCEELSGLPLAICKAVLIHQKLNTEGIYRQMFLEGEVTYDADGVRS